MFYREVLAQLQAYGVRYLVAGAVAMNLHGVPRMTADQWNSLRRTSARSSRP